jgi:CheY-like chemotaxis protein
VIAMRQVLVVEDDAAIRKLLTLHLQDIGCAVTEMDDGADALAAAVSDRSWARIILDLGLPRVDGLEICRRYRPAEVKDREKSIPTRSKIQGRLNLLRKPNCSILAPGRRTRSPNSYL